MKDPRNSLLDEKLAEGRRLQALRPLDHELRNDLHALVFLQQLLSKGITVNVEDADVCLDRMKRSLN